MILDQAALAVSLLEVTRQVYQVEPWRGDAAEPLPHAWERLFGEPMSPPMLFHYVEHAGRELVIRVHRGGRVSVLDQLGGRHEIRVLDRRWEKIVNASAERASRARPGYGDDRMAAAAQRFLLERSAS